MKHSVIATIITVVLIFLFCCNPKSYEEYSAGKRAVRSVKVIYPVDFAPEMDYKVALKFQFERNNGNKFVFNQMTHPDWFNRFNLSVQNGFYAGGDLFYDRDALIKNNKDVIVTFSYVDYPQLFSKDTIKIPRLQELSFYEVNLPQSILPGDSIPVDLVAEYSNGILYNTINAGHGGHKLNKKYFNYYLYDQKQTISSLEKVRYIKIPDSELNIKDTFVVNFYYILDSTKKTSLHLPVNYSISKTLDFAGSDGSPGDNSSGYAYNNQNGTSGQPGSDGGNGKNVKAFVKTVDHNGKKMAWLRVYSDGKEQKMAFDPATSKIKISCNGGNAGSGGMGGHGGEVIYSSNNNNNNRGGSGGPGGRGGEGGKGGKILVYADSSFIPYLDILEFSNTGGNGGMGGYGGNGGHNNYEHSKNKAVELVNLIVSLIPNPSGANGT